MGVEKQKQEQVEETSVCLCTEIIEINCERPAFSLLWRTKKKCRSYSTSSAWRRRNRCRSGRLVVRAEHWPGAGTPAITPAWVFYDEMSLLGSDRYLGNRYSYVYLSRFTGHRKQCPAASLGAGALTSGLVSVPSSG